MDWKQLVQFALLGSGNLEQYAVLLVRVSLGLFFAISLRNARCSQSPVSSSDSLFRVGRRVRLRILFFIWLLCSGPGKFSADHWLVGKLLQ
jgi:hypothetical protein